MKLVFLTVILLLPIGKIWAVTAKLSGSKDLNAAAFGIVNFWCKEVIRGSHPSCANVATRHELVEAYKLSSYQHTNKNNEEDFYLPDNAARSFMLQATVNGTRYFLRLYVNEDSQYSSRPAYANMGTISDKGWLSTHKGGVFKGDKGINARIVHRPDTKVWLNQTKVTANELVIFNPTNNFRESWKK